MAISTLQNEKTQEGVYQFTAVVNKATSKQISWKSYGTSMEIWVQNNGSDNIQISFDNGNGWWTLPIGATDVYRVATKSLLIKRKNGSGSNNVDFKILLSNPNPKWPYPGNFGGVR